ncbi:MAG: helix-turn-helix transcriptional regulator [Eubacterium sp.]|nr:helix-turn-helix transcriptional regulator [Eubacterium sp.]MDE6123953.1 helix-turn-helix transcriptional regulator [Eubacterium sp.]
MIKENRNKMKLSQEQLAEKINISTRQLQRIEKAEEKTKLTTLKKIINVLEISDEEIIDFMKR